MATIMTARQIMRQRLAELQSTCDALRQELDNDDFLLDMPIDQDDLVAYAKEAYLDCLAMGNAQTIEKTLDADMLTELAHNARTDFLDAYLDMLADGMPLRMDGGRRYLGQTPKTND